MNDTFIDLLLAHFIADFFFQTKNMAEQKYKLDKIGFMFCSFHIATYTIVVCAYMFLFSENWNFSILFVIILAIPHWIIDRNSLAAKWMKIIERDNLFRSKDSLQVGFGAVIYVVIDQVMHILCLRILVELV